LVRGAEKSDLAAIRCPPCTAVTRIAGESQRLLAPDHRCVNPRIRPSPGKGDLVAVGRKSWLELKIGQAEQRYYFNGRQCRFRLIPRKPPDPEPGEEH